MKSKVFFLATALAAASLASCHKEEGGLKPVVTDADFRASIENEQTKVGVTPAGLVVWKSSDKISVNGGVYAICGMDSPTFAYFKYESGSMPKEGDPFCAFFPSEIQSTDSLGILPGVWKYDPESVNNLPMYAYSTDNTLKFRNVCSALKITVDSKILVKKVKVSSDLPIAGSFVVMNGDSLALNHVIDSMNVVLDCGEGVKGTDFYIPIPAGRYGDLDFFVTGVVDGVDTTLKMVSTFGAMNIPNNTIYPVTFTPVPRTTDAEILAEEVEVMNFFVDNLIRPCKDGYSPLTVAYDLCGDDVQVADYDGNKDLFEYNTLTYKKDNKVVENVFNGLVFTICKTCKFLKYWDKVKSTPVQMKACAEVRTLRAYLHLLLALGRDHTPIIEQDIFSEGSYADSLQNTEIDVGAIIWCSEELGEIDSKVLDPSIQTQEIFKVDEWALNALYAKAMMYIKRSHDVDRSGKFSEALSVLNNIKNSKKFELESDYGSLFHSEGNESKEKLLVVKYSPSYEDFALFDWRSQAFVMDPSAVYTGNVQGIGCVGVKQEFVEEWKNDGGADCGRFDETVMNAGNVLFPAPGDSKMKYSDPVINAMSTAEKRASDKVGIRGDGMKCQSFYLPFKQVNKASDIGARYFTIIRYSEIYLEIAECDNEINGPTQVAIDAINTVLKRSEEKEKKLRDYTSADALREDLFNKFYPREFFLEGRRWIEQICYVFFRHKHGMITDMTECLRGNRKYTTLCDTMFRKPSQEEISSGRVKWETGDQATSRLYTLTTDLGTEGLTEKYLNFPYPEWFLKKCPLVKQSSGWE